jgi:hypothetical protein
MSKKRGRSDKTTAGPGSIVDKERDGNFKTCRIHFKEKVRHAIDSSEVD